MIDENNILSESEMNTKIKKIEQFLESKLIFCKKSWIKEKIEIFKNANKLEDKIYDEAIKSDIYTFIDADKAKKHFNLQENFKFDVKHKNLNAYIFLQILGYSNIAEPSEKVDKNSENLDVLDNFESKFLQSEGEENKKAEKVVLKLQLTDGIETIYGFEYENIKDFRNKLNNLPSEIKHPKVLLGPNFEVRRGIIYLKNDNISLL